MVRLNRFKSQLQQVSEVCGTTLHALGPSIPDGKFRRVYRVKLQQRGATLGNVYFYKGLGATVGSTIEQFKFDVLNQIIDVTAINDNLPIWSDVNRATYDNIMASIETASVDVYMLFADENELEYTG